MLKNTRYPLKVLVISAQALTGTSLCALLARHPELCVVAYVHSINALAAIQATQPHLLLVDLDSQSGIDLALASKLRAAHSILPVVALLSGIDAALTPQLLATDAQAYLTKDRSEAELVATIQAVVLAENRQLVDTDLIKQCRPLSGAEHEQPRPTLTNREQEVVSLLLAGLSNEQIAKHMAINPQSVRNYERNIYAKVGVNSCPELILYFTRPHLPSSPLTPAP